MDQDEEAKQEEQKVDQDQEAKQEEQKVDQDANAGSGEANGTDQLIKDMANLNVREPGDFTYEDLVNGLKQGRF